MNNNFTNPFGEYDPNDPYDPQRIRRTRYLGQVQYIGAETRPRSGAISIATQDPIREGMELPGMRDPRSVIDRMLGIGNEYFLDREIESLLGVDINGVVAGNFRPFKDDIDVMIDRFDFVMKSVNLELQSNPQNTKYIQARQTLRDAGSLSFAQQLTIPISIDITPFGFAPKAKKLETLRKLHRFRDFHSKNRLYFRGKNVRDIATLVEQIPDELV